VTSTSTSTSTVARDGLEALFSPRSVAIVGASRRATSLASRPLTLLERYGFEGGIHPVNPSYDEIDGHTCFPSVSAIPGGVDLVGIIVPARRTLEVVRDCIAGGARAAVLFASGFAELGPEGRALQAQLVEEARAGGLRLLGPNCQGIVHRPSNLVLSISASLQSSVPPSGNVAYVGQSGAIGGSVLHVAATRGLGMGSWISTGNEADLDLVEVASHVVEDPTIEVVACYLESIGDGAAYEELAARADELGKDLVVLRSGRSDAGRRAVESHTGALLTPGAAFVGVSERHGVSLVDDTDGLVETAFALSANPRPSGGNLGIVTSSGGAGILAADHAERHGLTVPSLPDEVRERLAAWVPDYGAVANPVDLTAQLFAGPDEADVFRRICVEVGTARGIDAVVVTLTMVVGETAVRAVEAVLAAARELEVPVLLAWLAGDEQTEEARALAREANFPVFRSAGDACAAAAALARRGIHQPHVPREAVDDAPRTEALRAALDDDPHTEAEALPVLDALGVPRPRAVFVPGAEDVATAVDDLEGPLVVKVQSPDLAHKSDVGGVRVGVAVAAVAAAAEEMLASVARLRPSARVDGVLVQQMAAPGTELLLGLTSGTGGFPPLLTLGFGGVAAELYGDVATTPLPIGPDDVDRLLGELQAVPLLRGFRGADPADIAALRDVVVRVAAAYASVADQLAELEINPLIVHAEGRGVSAVDVLLRRAG
jgi:acetate---CoA ligase (ADP-forming)